MSYYSQIQNDLRQNPRTWLITGVAGFIGNHLLAQLLSLNQKVIGLDNFSSSTPADLERTLAQFDSTQQNNFIFHQGDILSKEMCVHVMDNIDIVLHQAAIASVPLSVDNPELVQEVNVRGFLNILMAAKNANIRRIVYASSCAVYGDSKQMPKTEETPLLPSSPYAASKACNEMDAFAFGKTYGLETVGLRYFNVYGPHQNPAGPYAAVLPAWIKAIVTQTSIEINGDGEISRDFCHVKDIVQANILAATTQNKTAVNTIYNVGSGAETSLNQLCEYIKIAFNQTQHPVKYNPERLGDIKHSRACIEKIQSLLHFQATKLCPSALTPEAMQIPFVQSRP